MTDWNRVTLGALAAQYPSSEWDVLRGIDAPEDRLICMTYPDLTVAVAALDTAGFEPFRLAVPCPELDGPFDITTCMRYSAGGGQDVVLVRRLA